MNGYGGYTRVREGQGGRRRQARDLEHGQMNQYTDSGKPVDEGVKERRGRRKEMTRIHEGVWATDRALMDAPGGWRVGEGLKKVLHSVDGGVNGRLEEGVG